MVSTGTPPAAPFRRVNVLALTIFVSSILAVFFSVLWLLHAIDHRHFSERDALLPLESDSPTPLPTHSDQP